MAYELRPYQVKMFDEIRELMLGGCRSILAQAPTGSGKTVLVAKMASTAASKGMPVWFINHRRELVKQSMRTFSNMEIDHGVISSSFMEDHRPLVQICSIQTVVNRLDTLRRPKLIIWDECHHLGAKGWSRIFSAYPDAFHIGLTATPQRLDGKGLGAHFKAMVKGPSVEWLIENNYLSNYRLFAPPTASLEGVHTRMGDYVRSELNSVYNKPSITGDVITEYKRRAEGKRAIVFAVSVEHSKSIVDQFNAAGIAAAHVDGETDQFMRDQAIGDFAEGKIRILSNVELFGEGFDLPSIECAILLRPTQSVGLYLQQVGRALRPSEGKTHAIILDHAGNCERHGLPDENREWTLDGSAGARRTGEAKSKSVKVCPKCFAAQWSGQSVCLFCSEPFKIQSRKVDEKDGDLEEVSKETLKKRGAENRVAETMADLIKLGKERGYKRPFFWAKKIFNGRQRKKIGG